LGLAKVCHSFFYLSLLTKKDWAYELELLI